jgi:hypothetical protein
MGQQMEHWRNLVHLIKAAELKARACRADADVAESKAYLRAEGPETRRRHEARADDDVVRRRFEADVAEVEVSHLKRAIDVCRAQIDVYRSQGSYKKGELATLGSTPSSWT